jgi:hypothetical protein
MTPNPPPPTPYTLYTCVQYTYLHREVGGGRANQGEGLRGNGSQSRSNIGTNMVEYLQSINY